MNIRSFTRFVSVTALVAVLGVGAALGWPNWMWFLLPALCAGFLLLDMQVPRSRPRHAAQAPEPGEAEPDIPPENPYRDTPVVVVPVESAVADCPFLFSATVWWRPADERDPWAHGNPAALASASVLRRVERMTSTAHPDRCTFLGYSMESALGVPAPDDEGRVIAYATGIRLVLRQKDQEHLDELDGLRKAVDTWESRRQHERNIREYLGGDVLRSPGSAVVWWMARHDDEIERAVEMIAPLAALSAAANDEEIPEEYRDLFRVWKGAAGQDLAREADASAPIGAQAPPDDSPGPPGAAERAASLSDQLPFFMSSLGIDQDSVEGTAFLHRLANASDAVGRPEAAENIRRHLRGEDPERSAPAAGPFEDGPRTPPPAGGSPDGDFSAGGSPDGDFSPGNPGTSPEGGGAPDGETAGGGVPGGGMPGGYRTNGVHPPGATDPTGNEWWGRPEGEA